MVLFSGEGLALSDALSPAGIATVSGGFGEEELAEIERLATGYSLSLTFATRTGAYVADVDLRTADGGGEVLVEISGTGPKLLAGLPAGIYRITATQGRARVQQAVTLEGGKPRRLTLFFPDPEPTAQVE